MIALLLAALAAGSAPVPTKPAGLLRLDDYPGTSLAGREQGPVVADVMVDPAGRAVSCKIALSTGHDRLDKLTCRMLMARGRFRPARDEQGVAVAGVYRAQFDWVIDQPHRGVRPDGMLPVSRLPAGTKAPFTTVRQTIAADGKVESCAIQASSGSDALDKLACNAAAGMAKAGAVTDAAGKPVRGVRQYVIAFGPPVKGVPDPVN